MKLRPSDQKFLFIFILLLSLVGISYSFTDNVNRPQQPKQTIIGDKAYGNWSITKNGDFYKTSFLNNIALLTKEHGYTSVIILTPDLNCTEYENSGSHAVLQINMIPVKFKSACRSRGVNAYYPNDTTENKIVIDEFKNKNEVLITNSWWSTGMLFSAIGFTKAYNIINQ